MLTKLSHAEIEELLYANTLGRIGCAAAGMPYIVPVNYRYEGGYVQCQSLEGLKLQIMRNNPDVCFEVEQILDAHHWATVICWGIYEEITDERQLAALREAYRSQILKKRAALTPQPPAGSAERGFDEPKPEQPVFYRIRLTKFTGRREERF